MIRVNGKELDVHGLRARVKLRREHLLYAPELLELLERDLLAVMRESRDQGFASLHGLRRALDEEDEEKDRRREEGSRWRRLVSATRREQEEAAAKSGGPARPAPAGAEEATPPGAEEPPPAADGGAAPQPRAKGERGDGKRPPLRRMIAHAVTMRVVQGVGEGYFQQLKQFNIFAARELEILHRLLRSGSRGPYPGRERRGGVWLASRPAWSAQAAEYAAGLCGAGAVVVGIPGHALLEALWEKGLLALAADDHARAVAEAQSRFYPARYHPRPLELLENAGMAGADLLIVPFPECMDGPQLEGLLRWAGGNLGGGGGVLLGRGGGEARRFPYEDGFARFWPEAFLRALLEREGFAVEEREEAGTALLRGEKGAGG